VDLANSLFTNLHAVNLEPQSFLYGKVLVSKKCRLVEVEDILTWTEAFTIYYLLSFTIYYLKGDLCFPSLRWSDLTKYKLLIMQTVCYSPCHFWLEYDQVVFQKYAAATGASDW